MKIHRINKEFDKVICINLVERADKKEIMNAKFKKLGIVVDWYQTVQFGFVPQIVQLINTPNQHFNPKQPYEFGASLSHYSVIKQAYLEGVERLFVFEDDAKFHKDFNNKFDNWYDDLPSNWDMFLLYSFMYELYPQNVRVSKRWIRSYKSWSLMSYAMNRKMMGEYIKRQDLFLQIADVVTYNMQEDSNFNIYSAIPSLCIPETKMGSDIRGANMMNYASNPTVTNLGYANENYE